MPSEFPDNGWKVRSTESLLKRSHKKGTIVWQSGSGRQCSSCSSGGPCAQPGGQAKKAPISSWDFASNCYSPFKCAQDNSPWSPAQMLQKMSWSAVVWSHRRRQRCCIVFSRNTANKLNRTWYLGLGLHVHRPDFLQFLGLAGHFFLQAGILLLNV